MYKTLNIQCTKASCMSIGHNYKPVVIKMDPLLFFNPMTG